MSRESGMADDQDALHRSSIQDDVGCWFCFELAEVEESRCRSLTLLDLVNDGDMLDEPPNGIRTERLLLLTMTKVVMGRSPSLQSASPKTRRRSPASISTTMAGTHQYPRNPTPSTHPLPDAPSCWFLVDRFRAKLHSGLKMREEKASTEKS